MVSPPTANPKTRSRSASSKASTTKSASSRDEPTDCATTNISASKCSPACCRRYDPPKSPTRFPEDPKLNGVMAKVADLGIEGTGQLKSKEYQGVLQTELAMTLKESANCRKDVFEKLVDKMLPHGGAFAQSSPPQPPMIING